MGVRVKIDDVVSFVVPLEEHARAFLKGDLGIVLRDAEHVDLLSADQLAVKAAIDAPKSRRLRDQHNSTHGAALSQSAAPSPAGLIPAGINICGDFPRLNGRGFRAANRAGAASGAVA
jgi:hypothetical protein